MAGVIRSSIFRYAIAIGVFAALLIVPYAIQRLFAFSFDTTFLIIISMIASAWYLGRGPGLLVAFAFETALVYFSAPAFTARAVFVSINRLVLFGSVVLFASARRLAERRLREQQEVLQVTLSSIGDAVIATDIEGKISFLNPTAEQLTGWRFADASGLHIDEIFKIVNEDDRSKPIESPFTLVKRKGVTVGLANHTILLAKDGREHPIDDSGAPIRDNRGSVIGVIIVFHDVTEKRLLENDRELLLKRETAARTDAEVANRLKDDFLSTVSHELRTPLNAIVGWTGLLKNNALPTADAIQNALNVIDRNARAQNKLIDDILDVSRIMSGKLVIEQNSVVLTDVIDAAIETIFPAADEKNIEITTCYSDRRPVVRGDEDRLQQVFWNILSNAVKFTREHGNVTVHLDIEGAAARVSIRDSGTGIEPQNLPFIFDRFRQIDSSTRRGHGGLGLGLAIVRNLVEFHGGTVAAESAGAGQGSTFTVLLPIEKNAQISATDADHNGKVDLSGIKVLVVDDNRDSLDMCRVGLEMFGAETRGAESCFAAFSLFSEFRPDVLVSDLGMPEEDGFDLIAKIRALDPDDGGATPAAALTAYARQQDRQKAIDAGFQTHVTKPVDMTELATEIMRMLSGAE